MDSRSSDHLDSPKPKRLKTLASNVKFSEGNVLLHQFVLDNSHPNVSGSEIYVRAVLLSMSDAPAVAVNARNDDGYSALHLAVLKNNFKMVEKLLTCLTNINVDARCGRRGGRNTALHLAVESGRLLIVQELLNKGASIAIMNRNRETALKVAVRLRSLDAVKILVSPYANQHTLFNTWLHLAVRYGNLEIVRFLIDQGADVNARDGDGRTPLHEAAGYRSLEMLEFLIAQCADLAARARSETPPLREAESLEIVEFLIAEGADVNARGGEDGFTPLQEAAHIGRLDIVKLLIGKGADLHATNEDGQTPLFDAVMGGKLECVSFLLDQGAHFHADRCGWTPLHVAVHASHVDLVRFLLDKGHDLNARNRYGQTPLDLAIKRKLQSCIDALQNVG